MEKITAHILIATFVLMTVSIAPLPAGAQGPANVPKFPLPVAMTSPGQAPEGEIVNLLFERNKMKVHYDPSMPPNDLKGHKTLIVILGGSGKGLGSAGVDIRDELNRANALLNEAKKLGIKLVGMHLGGEDRRGEVSAKFIDLLAPKMAHLTVRADGNKDNKFTEIAKKNKIPLTIVNKNAEVAEVLKKMFE